MGWPLNFQNHRQILVPSVPLVCGLMCVLLYSSHDRRSFFRLLLVMVFYHCSKKELRQSCVEQPRESAKQLLTLVNKFDKTAGCASVIELLKIPFKHHTKSKITF